MAVEKKVNYFHMHEPRLNCRFENTVRIFSVRKHATEPYVCVSVFTYVFFPSIYTYIPTSLEHIIVS